MVTDLTMSADGAALATSVRSLARRAHRLLGDVDRDPREVGSLRRQVSRLRSQVRGRGPGDDLRRWLDNLQRQLDGHRP